MGVSSVDYKAAHFLATNGTHFLAQRIRLSTDLRPLAGNRLVEIVESLIRYTEVLVREFRLIVALPDPIAQGRANI
jgi:hypothetical protein